MLFANGITVLGVLLATVSIGSAWAGDSRPFGIDLGQPLSKNVKAKGPYKRSAAHQYQEVQPPLPPVLQPPQIKAKWPDNYSLYTTTKSKRVYRVSASLPYGNRSDCRAAGENFIRDYGEAPGTWRKGQISFEKGLDLLTGVFGGKEPGAFDRGNPLTLKDVGKLAGQHGVRYVVACADNKIMLHFYHLPTVELRIAEAYQSSPMLSKVYSPDKSGAKPPAYLSPFGFRIGKPLPKALRKGLTKESDDSLTQYFVTPPQPHKLFWDYTAITSPMTETLVSIAATRAIKGRDECRESMREVSYRFAKAFGVEKPKWYINTAAKFYHATLLPSAGKKNALPVEVRFLCEPASIVNAKDFSGVFGQRGRGMKWRAMATFDLYGIYGVIDAERELMNPMEGM